MFDIIIKGGNVIDGLCDKSYKADVGIVGDKIEAVGNLKDMESKILINASGKTVAPGFIDIHTHSDMSLIYDPKSSSKIYDGVTSEVIGNCGIGVAPICDERKKELIAYLGTRLIGTIPVKLELPWNTMEEYLDYLRQNPTATNVIPLVAQGAIRINEMGFSPEAPTSEQMERMKAEIKKAMDLGCVGISSGLVYMPGEFSTKDELAQLCTAVASYDSFYVSHIRSESDSLFEAIDEAIYIAKNAGTALHISHLKMSGSKVWGQTDKLFEKIENAKQQGLDVTFDSYPYSSACTSLGACMPPWAFEGGTDEMIKRIQIPEIQKRIKYDIENGIAGWQNFIKAAGTWDNITFAAVITDKGQWMLGKTIAQVAHEIGCDPYDVVFNSLVQESGRIQILVKMMLDEDVEKIISHPDAMVGSDGMSLSMEGIMSSGNPHPRAFGTHGRVLAHFVREKKLITLEEAIKKFTSKPASRLRLDRRGQLKEGYFADVVIFDPDKVQDMATFDNPKQYTRGIDTVIVNGELALQDGKQTDNLSGHVIGSIRK